MCEILAPAGDETSAYSAINAGADAIYLGLTAFSARSSAENFGWENLEKLVAYAHFFGVKIYVAMNTLVKDSELGEFVSSAVRVHNLGADAIIIQDIYLGAYIKKTYPDMCLHLSTQAGVCNSYGARYAKELGFSRVILARETPLKEVQEIAKIIETEVFVQGALCTCFSGQCYLSSFAGGNSGNRGKCKQPCRKKYKIDRRGFSDYAYRISLSDLSVGEDVKKLIEAGVSSLKIEGRMRRAEYVSAAVGYYKNILAGVGKKSDLSALKRTYNRGNYTKGLAFGQDKSLISSAVQGHIGEYVGVVSVESGRYVLRTFSDCGEGDGFKILRDGRELCGALYGGGVKGGVVLRSSTRLKNGDKVFITTDTKLNSRLISLCRTLPVSLSIKIKAGESPSCAIDGQEFTADFKAEAAKGRPITCEDVVNCFNKVDAYPFSPDYESVEIEENTFVPMSLLNAFRRAAYAQFFALHSANPNKEIAKVFPVPAYNFTGKNTKTCVMARSLCGVSADIGVLKPDDYSSDLSALISDFGGEKYLYLPPFLTGDEIECIKPLISAFDGIYGVGNYTVPLARELNKKLFAGVGFNLFNSVAVSLCPADYITLSKELTAREAQALSFEKSFYLSSGGIKVMDLIYCPFEKNCKDCDRRNSYTLTDEDGREFPLRRYYVSSCRFELYNCACLQSKNKFTGILIDNTFADSAYKGHTKGHTQTPVL